MIGDEDPEDAYDASDPPAEQLKVLRRAVPHIVVERDGDRREARLAWAHVALDRLARSREPSIEVWKLEQLRTELQGGAQWATDT